MGLTSVYAKGKFHVSDVVNASFKKEFAGAQSVTWSQIWDYQRALFIFDQHRVEAYFNSNGVLEGFARGILYKEMPMAVMISLEKHFPTADFVAILEVSNTEGFFYCLTVEKQSKLYRVKASVNGTIIEIVKKNRY